jgi:hypothetical protein
LTGCTGEEISRFQEKKRLFFGPAGTSLFSGHIGHQENNLIGAGCRVARFFAHFLTRLFCTVFSRLNRVFSKNNDLNAEFPRALAPFPLPNFFGFGSSDFSVEDP